MRKYRRSDRRGRREKRPLLSVWMTEMRRLTRLGQAKEQLSRVPFETSIRRLGDGHWKPVLHRLHRFPQPAIAALFASPHAPKL